jgi:hypothetical protein
MNVGVNSTELQFLICLCNSVKSDILAGNSEERDHSEGYNITANERFSICERGLDSSGMCGVFQTVINIRAS